MAYCRRWHHNLYVYYSIRFVLFSNYSLQLLQAKHIFQIVSAPIHSFFNETTGGNWNRYFLRQNFSMAQLFRSSFSSINGLFPYPQKQRDPHTPLPPPNYYNLLHSLQICSWDVADIRCQKMKRLMGGGHTVFFFFLFWRAVCASQSGSNFLKWVRPTNGNWKIDEVLIEGA